MTMLVGDNTETSTVAIGPVSPLPGVSFTEFVAVESGVVSSGYFYVTDTGATMYVVVYDSAGNFLYQSNPSAATVAGWNSVSFQTEFDVLSGTNYIVGVFYDTAYPVIGLGGSGSSKYKNGAGTWPTAPSTLVAQGNISTSTNLSIYLDGTVEVIPAVTTVNNDNPIAEGTTGIPIVGTNFAAGMTVAITQPNGISVAQANVTVTSSTTATFDLVMEPLVTDQLAFTDSTYVTNLVVTLNGMASQPVPVTLTPLVTGIPFQTLGRPNPIPEQRIAAIPDFVSGDQLEFAGDATGTTAPPAGTVPHADGSFEATADFYVRAYIQADAAWTPWTLITVSPEQPGQGFF